MSKANINTHINTQNVERVHRENQNILNSTVFVFTGLKRSGKDTCVKLLQQYLQDNFNVTSKIHAFANPMKNILSKSFNISLERLEELKNDETEIQAGTTTLTNFRRFIEDFGQAVKEEFDEDFWANKTFYNIITHVGYNIVSDLRFPIEYEVLNDLRRGYHNVVYIKVNNHNVKPSGSVAESSLDSFIPDYHIQNHIKYTDNNEGVFTKETVEQDLTEQLAYIVDSVLTNYKNNCEGVDIENSI
jgi:hypothetical protein